MKTEVVLKRELLGGEISQKSKSGFFCLNDLFTVGNKWRLLNDLSAKDMRRWIDSAPVKEFIESLEDEFGKVKIAGRGRGGRTWVHPFIFIDAALYLNPKLKIEVYKWLYDELLKYRNDSGDSYKLMCGALYANTKSKTTFHKDVSKLAKIIKNVCDVDDWNSCDESKLELRDKIHNNIFLLCGVLRNNKQSIRVGINKALESHSFDSDSLTNKNYK